MVVWYNHRSGEFQNSHDSFILQAAVWHVQWWRKRVCESWCYLYQVQIGMCIVYYWRKLSFLKKTILGCQLMWCPTMLVMDAMPGSAASTLLSGSWWFRVCGKEVWMWLLVFAIVPRWFKVCTARNQWLPVYHKTKITCRARDGR